MCSLDFNVIENWALVFGLGRPSAPFLLNLKWPSPSNSPYNASNKLFDKDFIINYDINVYINNLADVRDYKIDSVLGMNLKNQKII